MESKSHDKNVLKGYNMLLYFAGSMIMYKPSEECITDFWKNGTLKKLPVSSANPNFIKAASQLRESCADSSICGKMLQEDFTRLFAREEMPLAPLFETYYQNSKMLMPGKTFTSVSEFYNSYGWNSRFKDKIKDDHLGIELLFLTILVEKYLELDDEACRIEMRKEIRRYISQHILTWLGEWNKKIQKHSNTLCYKGIGTLIYACIEDIYSIMENSRDAVSLNELKN
jgi:TorA maturation chaperone TorD